MSAIEVRPATSDRWKDLVALFGPNGAYSGCWCMWWRQSSKDYERDRGQPNRRSIRKLVSQDRVPGLLAYLDGEPVGWVSVADRTEFARLERSRLLARIDDEAVWSIVCFYIHRRHRRSGVGSALLRAAVEHAVAKGAHIVEGYPVDTRGGQVPGASIFTGTPSMFESAGFREVARPGEKRPIMRWQRGR